MRLAIRAICVGLLWAPAAFAMTYSVRPDGTGDFPTIQAAIDGAVDGDIIQLTNGTFRGDGNRDLDFQGRAITIRSQSGNPDDCVLDCQGSAMDPHRGFYFRSGEGLNARLEGITIEDGYCESGGGVRCDGASPTLINCVLANCEASGVGGGFDCWGGAAPRIESCDFEGNRATYLGGGAVCDHSSATFLNCRFADNYCWADGGGLVCWVASDVTVSGCEFEGNTTGMGGGGGAGLVTVEATVHVVDSAFRDNFTPVWGGGASIGYESNVTMTRCGFVRNSAGEGGGALAVGALVALEDCTLVLNLGGQLGGAIHSLGGVVTIAGCMLFGNSAVSGSAAYCGNGTEIEGTRTIVAQGSGAESVICEGSGSAGFSCTDMFGNEGGDWTGCLAGQGGEAGNISADPLFCDPGNADFTLHGNSPCAPDYNPDCGLIGAWPVGCGGTPVEQTTWGALKSLFR